MKTQRSLFLWITAMVLIPLAVAGTGATQVFSGAAAFGLAEKAVQFGQRPSGSDAQTRQRQWIEEQLKATGATVMQDSFTGMTPTGPVPMVNIIARFPGTTGKIVAVTGHYDTKRIPFVNFVGANDGASSTGFLLELARTLKGAPHKDELDVIWFDGEEAVAQWTETDSRYGSRHLAQRWQQDGTLSKVKALINVDMIGDRDLTILNDSGSDAGLRQRLLQVASRLDYGKYFLKTEGAIDDDHVPFVAMGVPGIDIIDFNYGPANSYWHTEKDTMDKLSPRSLKVVGDCVLALLKDLEN